MPAFFSRLRSKSTSATSTARTEKGSNEFSGKDNKTTKSPVTPTSSNSRLHSWFSLKRSRKELGADQQSGRPPTPTPYLALTSAPSKDARPKKLKRVRPPPIDEEAVPEKGENHGKVVNEENSTETGDKENALTQEERVRLATFANGVRGLIAELKNAEKECRPTPPMTTENGTPLSPISEADELQDELEMRQEAPQCGIARIPSDSSVTELDYGELLDQPQFDANEEYEDEETSPRWNPDVVDLVETMMSGHCVKILPSASSAAERGLPGEGEGVDRVHINYEPVRDGETASETTVQDDTETEDDLEYFSAQSLVASSGEIVDRDVIPPSPGEGLHLQGVFISAASSSDSLDILDSSDDNEETIEDLTISAGTPRPSPRRRIPTQAHPMFQPDTIDGPVGLRRQRATTLPVGRERSIPALPHLLIPNFDEEEASPKGDESPEELMRTVAKLQREKLRLERALESASKKIEQQDKLIASLDAQISKLHAALVRFAQGDPQVPSSTNQELVPIVVRAPREFAREDSPVERRMNVGFASATGLITPDSATTTKAGLSTLSTPPATPDRRGLASLLEGSHARNDEQNGQKEALSAPSAPQGLVRRNSAGASSTLANLGVGRV